MKSNFSLIMTLFTALIAATACAEDETEATAKFNTLKCIGTEPFWSLDLKGQDITLEDLDSVRGSFKLSKAIASSNHTNRWFLTAVGSKRKDSKRADSLSLALFKTNQCSDGMSDFSYEYDVTISTPDAQVLSGCCNRIM